MFESLRSRFLSEKRRNVFFAGAGMLALLGGRKLSALALFGKGLAGLEKVWREEHPDFDGDLGERWQKALEFYEATHKDPMNRKLHVVGIPIIVAGTAGLLLFPAFRPFWTASAVAFAGGWILNFVGHGFFEKSAPAFADDPLSFFAGPIWDFQQLFGRRHETADFSRGNGSHAQATA